MIRCQLIKGNDSLPLQMFRIHSYTSIATNGISLSDNNYTIQLGTQEVAGLD